jgi:integrase
MRRVLTDALCRAHTAPLVGRSELADIRSPGLSFRVTKRGARSWCFRFRDPVSGRTSRATIGAYPSISLSDARSRADAMRKLVGSGINPIEEKRRDRAAAPTRTFGAVAARYLIEHAERRKRPRSVQEDRRNLDLHILPKWRGRLISAIKRVDVIELLEAIIASGKSTAANRVHSLISKIFSFAIDADIADSNPCARLRKRGVEGVGRRILTDAEIRLFWGAVLLPPISSTVGRALRLALLTGCRASEVAGARKDEISRLRERRQAVWIVPGERVKNKRDHLVPLSDLAVSLLTEAQQTAPHSAFLFPSPRGQGPIQGHALAVAMARLAEHFGTQQGQFAARDWETARKWTANPPTPHDLRRTIGTRLSEAGIPKEDRDAVLNHVRADVGTKHYDLYERMREKRMALDLWARTVAQLVAGKHRVSEVVPISAGRKRGHEHLGRVRA